MKAITIKKIVINKDQFIKELKEVTPMLKDAGWQAIGVKQLNKIFKPKPVFNDIDFIRISNDLGLKIHEFGWKLIPVWDFDEIKKL